MSSLLAFISMLTIAKPSYLVHLMKMLGFKFASMNGILLTEAADYLGLIL
ncbi:hypothetical protein CFBP498_49780 (plasmid) [Xanthomonas hortorum pv. vitians]|uniref:Uncharacterized protein n=1 Tax=Xanthomonas hortorum pv. vitians TaxID=83224 RepID=A0A6V7FKU0_9XANT|nr:hypothetical protein CFBP498_49780 [Xanthomonas hortorum pv. vitians]CAD0363920.1 hypothetical protein CFBP498_49780 [Xanthomonas hortorum pv. vitians]